MRRAVEEVVVIAGKKPPTFIVAVVEDNVVEAATLVRGRAGALKVARILAARSGGQTSYVRVTPVRQLVEEYQGV